MCICIKGGISMMNAAAANIFRKAIALKPDGLKGVLNNLDPEEAKLKELAGRLTRRRQYLRDLSIALNGSPSQLKKATLTKIVQPLSETVNKIQNWLDKAQTGLGNLNSTVKHQNSLLAHAITDFAKSNQQAFREINSSNSASKVNFVKAIA